MKTYIAPSINVVILETSEEILVTSVCTDVSDELLSDEMDYDC